MKNNTLSNNRLIQYAASAAAFLAVNNAQATVVYTDLDPDLAIGGEGGEITIDVNSDGTDDLGFFVYSILGTGTYYGIDFTYNVRVAGMSALNGNEILGSVVTYSGYSGVYAPILPDGEGINSEDNFAEGSGTLGVSVQVSLAGFPYYDYQGGVWLDSNMDYMGFRINVDKDRYYGWMRISVADNAGSITIHDYAYENEANKAIFTGQTATDVVNNPLADATIYSNAANVYVTIPQSVKGNADITIFDLAGKKVKAQQATSGNFTMDCNDLPSGNYLVYISQNDLSIKKQVSLTK